LRRRLAEFCPRQLRLPDSVQGSAEIETNKKQITSRPPLAAIPLDAFHRASDAPLCH